MIIQIHHLLHQDIHKLRSSLSRISPGHTYFILFLLITTVEWCLMAKQSQVKSHPSWPNLKSGKARLTNPNPNTRSNPGPATTIYCIGQQSRSLHKTCTLVHRTCTAIGSSCHKHNAEGCKYCCKATHLVLSQVVGSTVGWPLILILGKRTPTFYPPRLAPVNPAGFLSFLDTQCHVL